MNCNPRTMNCFKNAGPTRLELATSGLTGQRSNQMLNYDPDKSVIGEQFTVNSKISIPVFR